MVTFQITASYVRKGRLVAGLALLPVLTAPAFSQASRSAPPERHRAKAEVPQASQSLLSDAIAEAEKALDRKDYSGAEVLLRQAADRKSNNTDLNAQLWFDLGLAYKAENRVPEAIEAYRKAVAFAPGIFESNLNLGLLLAGDGHPQEAAQVLRKATELKPSIKPAEGLAKAWIALGQVLETTEPEKSMEAYSKASELQPQNLQPHLLAAAWLEKAKNYDSAEREYQAILKLDPRSTEALSGLVHIYANARRYPDAITLLRQYISAHANDARAFTQLALLLAEQKQLDEAGNAMNKAIELEPNDAGILKDAASFYARTGNYGKAEEVYRRLEQTAPNDADIHGALGEIEFHQRKFPEAVRELAAALQINPALVPLYEHLAYALSEVRNYAATIKVLDARARLAPDDPAVLFLRATSYDHLHEPKLASDAYRQFLLDAKGRFPDQEWQARQRIKAINPRER